MRSPLSGRRPGPAGRRWPHAVSAGAASAAFVLMARRARRGQVGVGEERLFRALNSLPSSAEVPVWAVMQAGSLAGVAGASTVAALHGRRSLAVRLGVTGTGVWGFCKLVKGAIRRGRPPAHLADVIVRGATQSGLGFPSGHAAVAFTLAGVAAPELSRRGARTAWGAVAVVGAARQYVGAHLPNDVIGGAAIGLAVSSVARLARPALR